MVTSKHHKMDENNNPFLVHIYTSTFGFYNNNFMTPSPLSIQILVYSYFLYVDYCMSNLHRGLCFFPFFKPKNIYLLIELSHLIFVLVYTWLRLAIHYYFIIHIMKNHHCNWTYVLEFFTRPFIDFYTNTIFIHLSLS